MRRAFAAAIGALGLLTPAALAQTPAPPQPAPAPAQSPAPAPAAGTLTLSLGHVARDGKRGAVVLAGERFTARGTVTPFRPGQRVVVRLHRGPRKLLTRSAPIRRVARGDRGRFAVTFRARDTGRLTVRAVHRATPELATLRSRPVRVRAITGSFSGRGPGVRLLQAGLDRLGYAVPRSGSFDAATGRAVMAYRKVNGMRRTTSPSKEILARVLRGRGAFEVRHPKAGRHLEADLSRQVLALIDRGRVVRTYTTSSGAPSTPTVLGTFRVYRRDLGTNSLGMVDAVYFIRGYAVHGYRSVPPYNASHGCLRVPIPDARSIHDWLTMGTKVIVYP